METSPILRRLEARTGAAISLGLGRTEAMLQELGSPQRHLPPVVHVAGTNGKGSLCAYLTAIAQAAGLKVHRYTSPHLVRFNERILLAGREIDDSTLERSLERTIDIAERLDATFFETTTVAAFLAFAETPADLLIVETGLGGRLDSTNIVERPVLTAITPVSLDHQDFLGNNLGAIAGEKAGILKRGVPLVLARQTDEARDAILARAESLDIDIEEEGVAWRWQVEGGIVSYRSSGLAVEIEPALEGAHQQANAAMAVACAERLGRLLPLSPDAIRHGIAQAVWPARLQRITHAASWPLPAGCELWLDGGHNRAAADMLTAWIAARGRPVDLVWGMMADKDPADFIARLLPNVRKIRAVPVGNPRAMVPEALAAIAPGRIVAAPDILSAIASLAGEGGSPGDILITGSLFLAGEVLAMIGRQEK